MVNRLLIILLLCVPGVFAADYYADIDIDVDNSGFVTITGNTNHPGLDIKDSSSYTSKKGEYWLLNVSLDDEFSNYVYDVTLPSSASINYLKSSGPIRIEQNNGNLAVKGFGEDKPFSVIVQYNLEKENGSNNVMLIGLIVLVILAFIIIKSKKIRKKKTKKPIEKEEKYDLKGLSSRQKKIMKLLIENKKPMTQGVIQSEMKIPKASVSRNIKALEIRGLIEKEQAGMSNMIKLK